MIPKYFFNKPPPKQSTTNQENRPKHVVRAGSFFIIKWSINTKNNNFAIFPNFRQHKIGKTKTNQHVICHKTNAY